MADSNAPMRIYHQGFTVSVAHKTYVDKLQAHFVEIAGK